MQTWTEAVVLLFTGFTDVGGGLCSVSVCVCVCGPCYTDEPLPLLDPGRVHAYFHSWWTISGLKWLWSEAGHFRGVPACFSALTAAVTVQAAPNFLTAARFLFAMGKVAVKSSMCLF